jgi:heme/copper-type cytochrome/quinol oxidase subunit 2
VTVAASPPPHPPPLPPQPSPANIIITITIITTNIIIIIIININIIIISFRRPAKNQNLIKKQKLKPCLFKSAALFLVLEFPVSTIRQRRSFLCLYEA